MDNPSETSTNNDINQQLSSMSSTIVSTLTSATPITSEIVSDFEPDPKFEITPLEMASYDCQDIYSTNLIEEQQPLTDNNDSEPAKNQAQRLTEHLAQAVGQAPTVEQTKQPNILDPHQIQQTTTNSSEVARLEAAESGAVNGQQQQQQTDDGPASDSKVQTNECNLELVGKGITEKTPATDPEISVSQIHAELTATSDLSQSKNPTQLGSNKDSAKKKELATNELIPEHHRLDFVSNASLTVGDRAIKNSETTSLYSISQTSVDAQMEKVIDNIVELGGIHQFPQSLGHPEGKEELLASIHREITSERSSIDLIADVASRQQSIEINPSIAPEQPMAVNSSAFATNETKEKVFEEPVIEEPVVEEIVARECFDDDKAPKDKDVAGFAENKALINQDEKHVAEPQVTEEKMTEETNAGRELIDEKVAEEKITEGKESEEKLAKAEIVDEKEAREKIVEEVPEKKGAGDEFAKQATEDVASEKLVKEEIVEEEVADEKMDVKDVAQAKLTQEEVVEMEVASEEIAQEQIAQGESAQELIAQEKVTQTEVPDEKNPEEKTSEEKTPEKKTSEEKTPEKKAHEEKAPATRPTSKRVTRKKVAQEKAAQEDLPEVKNGEEKVIEEKVAEEKVAQEKVVEEKVAEEKVAEEKVVEEPKCEERIFRPRRTRGRKSEEKVPEELCPAPTVEQPNDDLIKSVEHPAEQSTDQNSGEDSVQQTNVESSQPAERKERQSRSLRPKATLKRTHDAETQDEDPPKEEPPNKQFKRSRGSTSEQAPVIKLPNFRSRTTISTSNPVSRLDKMYEPASISTDSAKKFVCHECDYATDRINNLIYHFKKGFCKGKCQMGEVMKADITRQQQQARNKRRSMR